MKKWMKFSGEDWTGPELVGPIRQWHVRTLQVEVTVGTIIVLCEASHCFTVPIRYSCCLSAQDE